MPHTPAADRDRALDEVGAAVRSVDPETLDAVAAEIAAAKVIAAYAGGKTMAAPGRRRGGIAGRPGVGVLAQEVQG